MATHPLGMRGWGLLFLSPKGNYLSGSSCALGEKSLSFQTQSINITTWKWISTPTASELLGPVQIRTIRSQIYNYAILVLLCTSTIVWCYDFFFFLAFRVIKYCELLVVVFAGFLCWLLLQGSWSWNEEQYFHLVLEYCLKTLLCSSIPFSHAYQHRLINGLEFNCQYMFLDYFPIHASLTASSPEAATYR